MAQGRHSAGVGGFFGGAAVAVDHDGLEDVVDGALKQGDEIARHAAVLAGGFGAHGGQHLGPTRLADGVDAVLVGHVGALMGQDRGQLVFIGAGGQQAPGDEDGAAGTGKGIEFVGVQHRKVVALKGVGPGGLPGHRLAHFVDVLGDLGVLVERILAQDAGRHRPADVVFLGIGDFMGGLDRLGGAGGGNADGPR